MDDWVVMTGGVGGDQPGQVPQGAARAGGVGGESRPGRERHGQVESEES